jgi:hypothetical protein
MAASPTKEKMHNECITSEAVGKQKTKNIKIQESHKELMERITFFSLQQQKMSQVRNLAPTEKLESF